MRLTSVKFTGTKIGFAACALISEGSYSLNKDAERDFVDSDIIFVLTDDHGYWTCVVMVSYPCKRHILINLLPKESVLPGYDGSSVVLRPEQP